MKLKAKANAKINLTLDITGKRQDGYHLVDMIMQSVSLYDVVTVERTNCGITVTSDNNALGGENDICHKAAVLFFSQSKAVGGAEISVLKKTPLAAGLGGGSADAAAVLLMLNKLFDEPLDMAVLEELALRLGADVPFFLDGGTVRVGGIGEIFTPLPNIPKCFIVIAKNGQKGSTKQMYEIIDSEPVLRRPDNEKAIEALKNGDLAMLSDNVCNVFSAAWEHNAAEDIMAAHNALAVSLSGSGPSYFGIYKKLADAKAAVEELQTQGITAFLAEPTEKAIEIE